MPWTPRRAGLGRQALSQRRPVHFMLDWAPLAHHAARYLAADRGHFAREGLAVDIQRGFGSGDVVTTIASGAADLRGKRLAAPVGDAGRTLPQEHAESAPDFGGGEIEGLLRAARRSPATDSAGRVKLMKLGFVGIRDFHWRSAVIQARDGPACSDGCPMGEDGAALSRQAG